MHKKVMTTHPMAYRLGQTRVHPGITTPWVTSVEHLKCPDCDVMYIVTNGFDKQKFLETLAEQHKAAKQHPDYIPTDPDLTKLPMECDCEFDAEL
jgi:hypothetical protein